MAKWILCGLCFLVTISVGAASEKEQQGTIYVCDEKGNPVSDATFILYREDERLSEMTSNQQGYIIIENLSQGNYSLYQKNSKYGYLKLEEALVFSIDEQSKKNSWEILNPRMTGSIFLTIKNDDPSIQTAQILDEKLYVVKSMTLDDEMVFIEKLPIGTYYVKFEDEKEFKVNEHTLSFDITPSNYNTGYMLTLHQTINTYKEDYTFAFSLITAILMGAGLLVLIIRKKGLLKSLQER